MPKTVASYAEFKQIWANLETRFQAPHLHWGPEDIKLARYLLLKYPLHDLGGWAAEFWSRHSAPLYHDYRHPLRLFAHYLPEIRQEWE